jgi:transcriptional regulator with XRE-family HTH domain
MSDLKKQTGELIKKTRKERGLTQKQFGELLGVTEATASRFENGSQNLTLETLERIATVLKIEIIVSRK